MITTDHSNGSMCLGLIVLSAVLAILCAGCGSDDGGSNPSGTFEATEVDVSPLVGGRVLSVRAELGDKVSRGDTLVVIDTELTRLQREQAAARAAAISAQMEEARQQVEQAKSRLDLAATTLERTRQLVAQGSATVQQLDDVTAEYDVAASRVKAARARLNVLSAQEAEVEAALATLDRQLRDGVVLSPLDGTVLIKAVEPGEVTSAGRLALKIADLRTLELRVFLDESDLDLVRVGQEIPVMVDALEGEVLTGTVTWISPEAEFTPKNVQTRDARAQLVYAVKLDVNNATGNLHIGMPAEIDLSGK